MTTEVLVGNSYENKHNGRIIKIIERIITDNGTILYKVLDADNDTDFIGSWAFDKHWDARSLRDHNHDHDHKFVTMKTTINETNDGCDTHSQHLNTSGKEE